MAPPRLERIIAFPISLKKGKAILASPSGEAFFDFPLIARVSDRDLYEAKAPLYAVLLLLDL